MEKDGMMKANREQHTYSSRDSAGIETVNTLLTLTMLIHNIARAQARNL